MFTDIRRRVKLAIPRLVQTRRDVHRHQETGRTEFRTASLVAQRLAALGWEVHLGRQVLCDEARLGLPDAAEMEGRWRRARAQGGAEEYLEALRGGSRRDVSDRHGHVRCRALVGAWSIEWNLDTSDRQGVGIMSMEGAWP